MLQATNIVGEANHWDEVQTLARELFELRVKSDYFLELAKGDVSNACQMLMDAWLLQRVKEWETSDWIGASQKVKSFFPAQLDALKKRLPGTDIRNLRRYGFPGLSVEACAQQLGHGSAYQLIYRRFGRAIHSSDYAEFMAGSDVIQELEYREWRDPFIASVVHFAVAGMAEKINILVLERRHDEALDALGQRKKQLTPSNGRPMVPAD